MCKLCSWKHSSSIYVPPSYITGLLMFRLYYVYISLAFVYRHLVQYALPHLHILQHVHIFCICVTNYIICFVPCVYIAQCAHGLHLCITNLRKMYCMVCTFIFLLLMVFNSFWYFFPYIWNSKISYMCDLQLWFCRLQTFK